MTPEQFIKDYTRTDSNELIAVEDINGKKIISYHEWLTPEQALRAVELARQNLWHIQKGIILDGVVYELTENYPDNGFFTCKDCELHEKCRDLTDESLCDFFGEDESRKLFRKFKMKCKL